MSVNFSLFLCLLIIFNNEDLKIVSNKPSSRPMNVYFVSQLTCKVEIHSFHCTTRQADSRPLGVFQKSVIVCNLLQHALFAAILVALAGDVELNPGFRSLADVRKARGLKIVHINIRSLRYKMDSLRMEGIDTKSIDVLSLSETWIDQSIEDCEVTLQEFDCIRVDRKGNKKGFGGVVIYVREGLPFRIRHDLHSVDNECLWIELIRKNCRPTLICCVYRAPDVDLSAVISHLRISLANITLDSSDFVLLGDLNVDMVPYLRGNKKEKQDILNFACSLDLTQLITEATRVTKTSRSLIDVILVNNNHRISDSGVVPVTLSDHFLVYRVLKSGVTKAQPKTIEYRSYKNFDVNSFMADLNCVPWHVIENEDHIMGVPKKTKTVEITNNLIVRI